MRETSTKELSVNQPKVLPSNSPYVRLAKSDKNVHKLNVTTIRGRLQRGWSEDKALSTPKILKKGAGKSHPYRKVNYKFYSQKTLKRLGLDSNGKKLHTEATVL